MMASNFPCFSTSDDSSSYSEDCPICKHCQNIKESAQTVKYILRIIETRKTVKGTELKTLLRAANDILHSLSYPLKQCECNSLN